MRLLHSEWDFVFDFEENIAQCMVIENPSTYRELVWELKLQCSGEDGRFLLTNNDKSCLLSKTMELVSDVFEIDINSRKVISSLYKKASALTEEEGLYLKTQELRGAIATYLEELFYGFHYPILMDQTIEMEKLFKAMDVKFDCYNSSLAERLLDSTKAMLELGGVDLFAFCGLSSVFNSAELSQLLREWCYNKIPVLLIDVKEIATDCSMNTWIIDQDDCLINK